MLLYYSLAFALPYLTLSTAQEDATFTTNAAAAAQLPASQKWPDKLVGTWSTKSLSTLTGPGFYDPINDVLLEPEHTGISYSFTADGHYEEAFYRAIASPVNPACPQGVMQWQHGGYVVNATGSVFLAPIRVDGRQLVSNPCEGDKAVFMRWNQSELFKEYKVTTDKYHNVLRLDLYEWDGTPMNPMYLVYTPPQMLPTGTLNPIATATGDAQATNKIRKRDLTPDIPLSWKRTLQGKERIVRGIDADRLWWIGLGMTGVGGLLYLGPRRWMQIS